MNSYFSMYLYESGLRVNRIAILNHLISVVSTANQNGNAFLLILFLAQEAEVKYAEWDSRILVVHLFAKEHALVIHNLIIQL